MTPGERDWCERMIARWGEQVAVMRRIACGRQSILQRAGGLEEVVDRLRARLADAPIAAATPAPPVSAGYDFGSYQAEAEALAAADPVWFMRSHRAGMIYSAAVCRRFGDAETAARYERRAETGGDVNRAPGRGQAPPVIAVPIQPTPIALPFTAGPQLDMFA